jgi:hypothetical protein
MIRGDRANESTGDCCDCAADEPLLTCERGGAQVLDGRRRAAWYGLFRRFWNVATGEAGAEERLGLGLSILNAVGWGRWERWG